MKTTFQCNGQLIVTDPCYQGLDNINNHLIIDCVKGMWDSYIHTSNEGSWGYRVSTLTCEAVGHDKNKCRKSLYARDISVDSGQAGVFDYLDWLKLDRETSFEYGDDTSFYGKCCNGTCSDEQYANVDFGVCSSSGYGDGGYPCYIYTNYSTNLVEKIVISFLEDHDQEEEYEEE